MAALVISMGVLAYGYDSAFIGTTIAQESFKRDFGINASNKNEITSNITSIYSAGGLVGALLMYPFLELLGRRGHGSRVGISLRPDERGPPGAPRGPPRRRASAP